MLITTLNDMSTMLTIPLASSAGSTGLHCGSVYGNVPSRPGCLFSTTLSARLLFAITRASPRRSARLHLLSSISDPYFLSFSLSCLSHIPCLLQLQYIIHLSGSCVPATFPESVTLPQPKRDNFRQLVDSFKLSSTNEATLDFGCYLLPTTASCLGLRSRKVLLRFITLLLPAITIVLPPETRRLSPRLLGLVCHLHRHYYPTTDPVEKGNIWILSGPLETLPVLVRPILILRLPLPRRISRRISISLCFRLRPR